MPLDNHFFKIKRLDKFIRQIHINYPDIPANINVNLMDEIEAAHSKAIEINSIFQKPLLTDNPDPNLPAFPKVREDQDILLTGYLGNAGTYYMGKYYSNPLLERLPKWMIQESLEMKNFINQYPSSDILEHYDVSAAYVIAEGGIFRTLYQLGKDTHKGFQILYDHILFNQITIEFCEIFDINPMELFSCGCTLLITPKGNQLQRVLQNEQNIPCSIIGHTTASKDKVFLHDNYVSRINRPGPDALLSLLNHF